MSQPMYRLTDAEAVATLACHMPAGLTHPYLDRASLPEFLHERLTEAGYALVAVTRDAAGLPAPTNGYTAASGSELPPTGGTSGRG